MHFALEDLATASSNRPKLLADTFSQTPVSSRANFAEVRPGRRFAAQNTSAAKKTFLTTEQQFSWNCEDRSRTVLAEHWLIVYL